MSVCRFAFLTAVLLFPLSARAADPAVEVRLKSIDALLARAEFVGGLAGKGEEAKQFAGLAQAFTDKNTGLKGIDPAREFGFYATVTPDVVDSPVVLMVPVKDKLAFAGLLTDMLKLNPRREEEGLFSMDVPQVPKKVYFRIVHDYAYLTLGDPKTIAEASVISPEQFFAGKTDAVLAATVHLDRIPEEMKKVVFGQAELKMAEAKAKADATKTPTEQLADKFAMDGVTAMGRAAIFDGKTLALSLFVEPKADDLSVEINLTPKPGTALAKALAANAARPSEAAARVKGDNLAVYVGLKAAIPDDMLPALGKIADALSAQAAKDAKPEAKELAQAAADAALATLRAGDLDLGVATTRPRADGTIGITAALKIAKGSDVEAVLRQAAPHAPADEAVFTLDVAKLNGAALHKVELKGAGAAKLKAVTGSDTVWFAIGDSLAVVGTDEAAVRAAVAAKPGPGAGMQAETALAAIMAVQAKVEPNPAVTAAMKSVFGDAPAAGADSVKLTIEPGESLKIKLTTKGAVINFLRQVGEAGGK
jgi:hypothetical protein